MLHGDFARSDSFDNLGDKIIVAGHDKTHAGFKQPVGGAVYGPVGENEAFVAPFVAEEVDHQLGVGLGVVATDFVVGTHDSPGMSLAHAHFESGEIYLAEGALRDSGVVEFLACLLVVGNEVFQTCANPLALYAIYKVGR